MSSSSSSSRSESESSSEEEEKATGGESSSSSSGDGGDGSSASEKEQAGNDDVDGDIDNDDRVEKIQMEETLDLKKKINGDSSDSGVGGDTDDESRGATNPTSPPPISKTWTTLTTHSPCYTGGIVCFSHNTSLMDSAAFPSEEGQSSQHFLLAQRGGDISIIDSSTGVLLRTVRKGKMFEGGHGLSDSYKDNEEDNDDDEEIMDAEAITAFALSPNNVDVIAVTRSNLVRRYNLALATHVEEGTKGKDFKKVNRVKEEKKRSLNSVTSITDPARMAFSFGKSGHSLPVTKVAFHPAGTFFATGSVDGLVKVWDDRNGYATHALHPLSSEGSTGRGRYAVTCLEWRPTLASLVLAIGRDDGSIAIHDLLLNADDRKNASLPVALLRDHLSAVTCVAWHSDVSFKKSDGSAASAARHGRGLFFSSGRDSVINTWLISEEYAVDLSGPKRKKKKKTSRGDNHREPRSIKVSYSRIRTLPVYEQVEGMIILTRKFRPTSDKKDIVLATCGTRGKVRLWKATMGDKDGGVQNVVSDFSALASQTNDESFGEENGGYTSLHLTNNLMSTHQRPLLVAIDAEHNMTFLRMKWSADSTALEFGTDRAIVGHNGEILDISVVPHFGGHLKHAVAVASNSSQVRFFGLSRAGENEVTENAHNRSALSPIGLLDGHTAIVLSLDVSPCGRYLTTASKDKTMRVWHVPTQQCVAVATGHTEAIGSVALSKKIGCYDVGGKAAENGAGAFAVTASKDRTLKIWPLPGSAILDRWASTMDGTRSLRARLSAQAHEKDINIVCVAPNDSLIATGSQDKQVKLWKSTDLALHGTLKGHKRGVWDCQFSPHDRVVATASGDRTLKLWSVVDCSCVRTFQGHMAGVLRVRFLGTGLQLLSAGSDGLIKLWTIRTNECESTMDGHDSKIWALDLSPCGNALFSGGADSKIAVWRDTTKENSEAAREAEEQTILQEQKLSNHIRKEKYDEALEIALELEKPNQVLRVLTKIIARDAKNSSGIGTLQKHVVKWSPDRLTQMLKYCREWNTRARNSHIAMSVVKAVVSSIPAAKLASYDGVPEIFSGIAPYAERHFDRLDRMVGDSYIFDYTLFSMGSIHGESNEDYNEWVNRSKYVLPPNETEGKIQIGGSLKVFGGRKSRDKESDSSDEIVTIGESSDEN